MPSPPHLSTDLCPKQSPTFQLWARAIYQPGGIGSSLNIITPEQRSGEGHRSDGAALSQLPERSALEARSSRLVRGCLRQTAMFKMYRGLHKAGFSVTCPHCSKPTAATGVRATAVSAPQPCQLLAITIICPFLSKRMYLAHYTTASHRRLISTGSTRTLPKSQP